MQFQCWKSILRLSSEDIFSYKTKSVQAKAMSAWYNLTETRGGGCGGGGVVTKLCPTIWDPMDCSPPGSSVHEILQARISEWVAISFSRGSSPPKD